MKYLRQDNFPKFYFFRKFAPPGKQLCDTANAAKPAAVAVVIPPVMKTPETEQEKTNIGAIRAEVAKCAYQWFAIPVDPTPHQFLDKKNSSEPAIWVKRVCYGITDAYPNPKKGLSVEDGKVGGIDLDDDDDDTMDAAEGGK